jgi:hypothetical protein
MNVQTGFLRMLTAGWVSRALYTAAKLDLARAMYELGGSRVSVAALGEAVGANPSALRRLLRALASVGVFRTEDGSEGWSFGLTPLAELLRSEAPGSLRHAALMYGEEMADCWMELPAVVRDQQPAWSRVCGADHFAYFQHNPAAATTFDRAMCELGATIYDDAALAESYDFALALGDAPRVVDVGGGLGSFLSEILARVPGARGTLYESPHVLERARARRAPDADARMSFEAGDFFEHIPPGADAYILKRILHDWDDHRCRIILQRIADVMAPDGRVLVAETVVPTGDDDHFSKWLDLNMMVATGGLERTEAEFAALFESAGLSLIHAHPSPTPLYLLEARRR